MNIDVIEVSLEEMIQGLTGIREPNNAKNFYNTRSEALQLALIEFFHAEDEADISEQIFQNMKLSFAPKFNEFYKNECIEYMKTGVFRNKKLKKYDFYEILLQAGFPERMQLYRLAFEAEQVSDYEAYSGESVSKTAK